MRADFRKFAAAGRDYERQLSRAGCACLQWILDNSEGRRAKKKAATA